uniref:UBX domain-containing protein n=1 Tax=Globodera pallida TaxID=36090 RepID=A0A183CHS3_GLOPA
MSTKKTISEIEGTCQTSTYSGRFVALMKPLLLTCCESLVTRENPEVLQNEDNEVQELRRRAIISSKQEPTSTLVPPQPMPLTWSQWVQGIVVIPFQYFYSTTMDVLLFAYNLFFGPPSNRRPIDGGTHQNPQTAREPDVLADRIIMREQQKAYDKALAIDKQKTEQRKMEERRTREEADRAESKRAFLRQKREEVGATMRREPDGTEGDLVRIRISFPSCAKLERNFRHSDSLEDCPDNFSLFTNFPVKQLNCAPDWYRSAFCADADGSMENDEPIGTFAGAGLFKSANIVVRDNDA